MFTSSERDSFTKHGLFKRHGFLSNEKLVNARAVIFDHLERAGIRRDGKWHLEQISPNKGTWGWFEDDLRPTLWVSPTAEQAAAGSINQIGIGAYDLESGLKANSLRVTFDVQVNGKAPGHNFAQGLNPENGEPTRVLLDSMVSLPALGATMTVEIQDNAGHRTKIVRSFKNVAAPQCSTPPAKPTLVGPPNKSSVPKRRARLDWGDVSCNGHYEVMVQQTNKLGPIVFERTDLATSFIRTAKLTRGYRYVWRVRACNDAGCGTWSKRWKFDMP